MNGIGADGRAAMLNHLDSLLDETDANDLEEVRSCEVAKYVVEPTFDNRAYTHVLLQATSRKSTSPT